MIIITLIEDRIQLQVDVIVRVGRKAKSISIEQSFIRFFTIIAIYFISWLKIKIANNGEHVVFRGQSDPLIP